MNQELISYTNTTEFEPWCVQAPPQPGRPGCEGHPGTVWSSTKLLGVRRGPQSFQAIPEQPSASRHGGTKRFHWQHISVEPARDCPQKWRAVQVRALVCIKIMAMHKPNCARIWDALPRKRNAIDGRRQNRDLSCWRVRASPVK